MGNLLPQEGNTPKFAQLYIYDTDNEIKYRLEAMRTGSVVQEIDSRIVADIQCMLDENNVLMHTFRMAREKIIQGGSAEIKLRLIGRRNQDPRTYSLPTADEVAALIIGDDDAQIQERDVVVEYRTGLKKRITQLHPSYLALQYPLLFPYGEDGYTENIPFSDASATSSKTGVATESSSKTRVATKSSTTSRAAAKSSCKAKDTAESSSKTKDTAESSDGTRSAAESLTRTTVSIREYFAHVLHDRKNRISTILSVKKLLQQFIVDAYTMIESSRLLWIRENQPKLRVQMYKGMKESLIEGETDPRRHGKRVVVPSTFTGGARYMIQNYQDAMAICRWAGYPDLFITFTCNAKWPEVVRSVDSLNLKPEDRPDIVARIFKLKLDNLMVDLRRKRHFGSVKAAIYTIEFQKRGLPHAHILLFLNPTDKHRSPDDIDKIISAEIPDAELDPEYYKCVQDYMIHGPCGLANMNSPCMSDGHCMKYFPKKFSEATCLDEEGYPVYKRREDGREVLKKGVYLDNRFVVPHNRALLMKYHAHINVEWCNQSRSIKYLFKYINKGQDRITATFYETSSERAEEKECDEINMYYDCRYLSACESSWRIFSYEIHFRDPHVERLSFHLPEEHNILFTENQPLAVVLTQPTVRQTMFLAWMRANRKYPEARDLIYTDFPNKFVWRGREWKPRTQRFAIGRMFHVPPGSGELYYLRCLLNIVRGPRSYEEIRCIDGVQYKTFRDALYSLGLLEDDREYIDGIKDASQWASATSLRRLFATLLWSDSMSRPETVWEECWHYLSDDIVHRQHQTMSSNGDRLQDEQIKAFALAEIEKLLSNLGRSLRQFPSIQFPDLQMVHDNQNVMIVDERRYNIEEQHQHHLHFLTNCTIEQRIVYDTVLEACEGGSGGIFFVYGYGGTGKTYVWKGLSAAVRSKGDIVLNVASSGIASLLLPGGRTAHSRFKIPINVTEDSVCNINQRSSLADLIVMAKLIIWDEAPMTHRHCFEALDRTIRDIMRFHHNSSLTTPFGGKVVVLGGDFRQILPVIPKGSRQAIVNATVNSSYLWRYCKVLKLTKNMRLQTMCSADEASEISAFSKWIAAIGDGTLGGPNDGESMVELPEDIYCSKIQTIQ